MPLFSPKPLRADDRRGHRDRRGWAVLRAAFLLAALVVASPVAAQEPHRTPLHLTLGAFMVAQGCDLSTSMYAFGRGGFHEANPLLRPLQDRPIGFAVAKMGTASVLAYGLVRLHRTHPRWALILGAAGTALYTTAAIRNARVTAQGGS